MATLSIQHKHTQPEPVVREMLDQLLAQLHKEYDITSVANGQHIDFHRSGASGKLSIHPHQVDIEIKLSMMLSMFEKKIRSTITDYCKEYLP